MRRCALSVLAVVALCGACEFGETTIPDGDPIIVVHAIMRPDVSQQWIVVEQTFTGVGSDSSSGSIPGNQPQIPISGATVTVANTSLPSDPCGLTQFTESPADPDLPVSLGLYWGPPDCPTMRTGDTLELMIETVGGHVVTGRMEVPGANGMVLRVEGDSAIVPGPTLLFNRDIDTLDAEVLPEAGRALQLEVHRPDSMGFPLAVTRLFVDSTRMTVPGNLTDIFAVILGEEDSTDADDAESVFRAGRYYAVTLALMDDRYFDFARSGNVPISGRGFVNNLTGGMGVFGGMVAESNELKVVGEVDDSREGSYNMRGTVDGRAVDIDVELYVVATDQDTTATSAFVSGQWFYGDIDTSADGLFIGDDFELTVYQSDPNDATRLSAYVLSGSTGVGDPFTVDVYDRNQDLAGQLTATRVLAAAGFRK
ncbi:MAG: hypothetical protein JSW51_12900 [Gemmatimonadota bacterium]|nr:MAG: hypothetical protein JSW51_12900 [Gemmatimonadota bacterium]